MMKFDTSPLETGHFKVVPLPERLLASVAEKLRKITMAEQRIVDTVPVNLKLSAYGGAAKNPVSQKPVTAHETHRRVKKKHALPNRDRKLNEELRSKLAARLNRDTPVIQEHTVKGLVLTRNERKKIIAAVSLAEGSFVSVNKDTEFHMSASRAQQTHITYYGVVHIGLSWGLIQFTQDGGALGGLLDYMRKRDQPRFDAVFGDAATELVEVLAAEGVSGQELWRRMNSAQRQAHHLAGNEIRSARVQPVAVSLGREKKDIWEEPWLGRFKQAGLDDEFQELQLEYAVEHYLDHPEVYPFCVEAQIQTALGLALVVDRAVQAGTRLAEKTIRKIARQASIAIPFSGPAQERRLADYIVSHPGSGAISADHARRVKLLLDDPYRLLTVPLYDWDTYDPSHDK
jgi:hypothetical protein